MCPEFVSGLRDRVRVMLLYIYANKNSFPRQSRMRAIATRAATMHTTATGTLAAPHANATPQRSPHPHHTCVV